MKIPRCVKLCLVALALVAARPSMAETHVVKPVGEYATIDVRSTNEAMKALLQGSPADKEKAIKEVLAAPQKYAPPALYALSAALFTEGKKDEAGFWFYAGQLRGRFDANRCADVSARQAVAVLNMQFGRPINQYMMSDVSKLEAMVPRVVAWDKATPHDYDHRWINLHGMGAMISGMEGQQEKDTAMSLPKDQWDKVAEETRANYLKGFQEAMVELKARQKK